MPTLLLAQESLVDLLVTSRPQVFRYSQICLIRTQNRDRAERARYRDCPFIVGEIEIGKVLHHEKNCPKKRGVGIRYLQGKVIGFYDS